MDVLWDVQYFPMKNGDFPWFFVCLTEGIMDTYDIRMGLDGSIITDTYGILYGIIVVI